MYDVLFFFFFVECINTILGAMNHFDHHVLHPCLLHLVHGALSLTIIAGGPPPQT